MTDPSSIISIFLHDLKVNNYNILFKSSFDIQETDKDLLNKYIIYKFNQYTAMNIEYWSLYDSI